MRTFLKTLALSALLASSVQAQSSPKFEYCTVGGIETAAGAWYEIAGVKRFGEQESLFQVPKREDSSQSDPGYIGLLKVAHNLKDSGICPAFALSQENDTVCKWEYVTTPDPRATSVKEGNLWKQFTCSLYCDKANTTSDSVASDECSLR